MAEQGATNGEHTVTIDRQNSISIPDMSAIPKIFKANLRVESSLVLLITLSEIVASAVILALAKHEKPNTPLRPWIIGYLSVCVAFLPVIYLDYRVKKSIVDSIDSNISGRDDDSFDKLFRLAIPVECVKWVFVCFYFVWFIIGCVWVAKGRSSRTEAPLFFWLCVVFLVYRGLGYGLQFVTYVGQCCSTFLAAMFVLCVSCFGR